MHTLEPPAFVWFSIPFCFLCVVYSQIPHFQKFPLFTTKSVKNKLNGFPAFFLSHTPRSQCQLGRHTFHFGYKEKVGVGVVIIDSQDEVAWKGLNDVQEFPIIILCPRSSVVSLSVCGSIWRVKEDKGVGCQPVLDSGKELPVVQIVKAEH